MLHDSICASLKGGACNCPTAALALGLRRYRDPGKSELRTAFGPVRNVKEVRRDAPPADWIIFDEATDFKPEIWDTLATKLTQCVALKDGKRCLNDAPPWSPICSGCRCKGRKPATLWQRFCAWWRL